MVFSALALPTGVLESPAMLAPMSAPPPSTATAARPPGVPVNALCLAPEQPLPTDLWTADGRLLLAKGHALGSHDQIHALDGRQPRVRPEDAAAWMLATGDRSVIPTGTVVRRPQEATPAVTSPGLHSRWLDLHGALNLLLRRGAEASDALPRLNEIGTRLAQLVERQPDESLFVLVQLLYDGQTPYCASNALAAATLCELLGPLAQLPAPARVSLRQAALTMNIAMARLQDELAHQKAPPAEHQRAAIHAHPTAGHALLQQLGVTDAEWLHLVLNHHEAPDGSGYPAGRAVDSLSLQILRLADRFIARISPRRSRTSLSARQAVRAHYLELRDHPSQLGELLVRRLGLYLPGSYVKLRNGEIAVVTRISNTVDKPTVLSILNKDGLPYGAPRVRHTLAPEFQIVEPVLAEKVKLRLDPARVFAA